MTSFTYMLDVFFNFVTLVNSHCLSMNEAVNGIPPFSLSLSGQEAKQWQREAAWLVQLLPLLLVHSTADLRSLLELTVATKHDAIQENLD